jgi:hypothetical protein
LSGNLSSSWEILSRVARALSFSCAIPSPVAADYLARHAAVFIPQVHVATWSRSLRSDRANSPRVHRSIQVPRLPQGGLQGRQNRSLLDPGRRHLSRSHVPPRSSISGSSNTSQVCSTMYSIHLRFVHDTALLDSSRQNILPTGHLLRKTAKDCNPNCIQKTRS